MANMIVDGYLTAAQSKIDFIQTLFGRRTREMPSIIHLRHIMVMMRGQDITLQQIQLKY
jgi:hypothetical protein